MKTGVVTLLALTAIFLLTECYFYYAVIEEGNGDILGALLKTTVIVVFIPFFMRKQRWALWVLSILLMLHAVICFFIAVEVDPVFYFIASYNVFFGIYIHTAKNLQPMRGHRRVSESTVATQEIVDVPAHRYPMLIVRFKALMIDGWLLLTVLLSIMLLVEGSEYRTTIMVTSGLLIPGAYEACLTAYSRTVGQRLMKIRVGRFNNPTEPISLANACIRWLVKGLLGWLSFITINFNNGHRAIHDFASSSIVVHDDLGQYPT